RVPAPRAAPCERAARAEPRRHLREGVGLRLRTGLELARRVHRVSPAQARERRRNAAHPHGARCRLRPEGSVTFSVRVAIMTAAAVAVAAIGAAILMYFVVRTQLLSQFDNNLTEAAATVRNPRPGGGRQFPGGPQGTLTGRGDVAAQIIDSNSGTVGRSTTDPVVALVTDQAVAVARGEKPDAWFDTTLEGSHLRVYVIPGTQRGTAI